MIFFAVQLALLAFSDVAAVEFCIGLFLLPDRLIFSFQLIVVAAEITFVGLNFIIEVVVARKDFGAPRVILFELIPS